MRARAIVLFILAVSTALALTALNSSSQVLPSGLLFEDLLAQEVQHDRADTAAGKSLFEHHCALCHGIDGNGGRGPSLNRVQLVRAPDDAALRSFIANGIPPEMPWNPDLSEEDVANVAAYVRSLSKIRPQPVPGDPVWGARVYAKSGCTTCHIIAGDGSGYGPELTDIGARRSAQYLHQAIVKPVPTLPAASLEQRNVAEGFLLVEAITASGQTIRGIRVNEDTFSIQLKDAAGRFHSLRKQDLTELRKLRGQTPMPSYERTLSSVDLQDLVAYLASLWGKR